MGQGGQSFEAFDPNVRRRMCELALGGSQRNRGDLGAERMFRRGKKVQHRKVEERLVAIAHLEDLGPLRGRISPMIWEAISRSLF